MYDQFYTYYDGAYSISFANEDDGIAKAINTWNTWHIFPTTPPVVAPPERKISAIEIPYTDGALDVSDVLTHYPTYNNRTGSFNFGFAPGYGATIERYRDIVRALHGKRKKLWMTDVTPEDFDRNGLFYFIGRFTVGEYQNAEPYSTFDISYELEPYELSDMTSLEMFPDVFDNIKPNQSMSVVTDLGKYFSEYPTTPIITVTGDVEKGGNPTVTEQAEVVLTYFNRDLNKSRYIEGKLGSYRYPDIVFYAKDGVADADNAELCIFGGIQHDTKTKIDKISIEFRHGRL